MKKRWIVLIVILGFSILFNLFQLFQLIRFDYAIKECERLLLSQVRESREKEQKNEQRIEQLQQQLALKDSIIYSLLPKQN